MRISGTAAVADWLNPRRRGQAERLVEYLRWCGGKLYLTSHAYADIRHDASLDRYGVDQAMDDLYVLGLIDMRMAGDTPVIILLSDDLDRAATSPVAARPVTAPRFALTPSTKGGRA